VRSAGGQAEQGPGLTITDPRGAHSRNGAVPVSTTLVEDEVQTVLAVAACVCGAHRTLAARQLTRKWTLSAQGTAQGTAQP